MKPFSCTSIHRRLHLFIFSTSNKYLRPSRSLPPRPAESVLHRPLCTSSLAAQRGRDTESCTVLDFLERSPEAACLPIHSLPAIGARSDPGVQAYFDRITRIGTILRPIQLGQI